MPLAQCKPFPILQHIRQVKQLGYQLLHIAGGHMADHPPRGGQAVKAPVRQVKVPVLELDELPGEGGHPHQQVQHNAGVAVVGGVVVGAQHPGQPRTLLLQ